MDKFLRCWDTLPKDNNFGSYFNILLPYTPIKLRLTFAFPFPISANSNLIYTFQLLVISIYIYHYIKSATISYCSLRLRLPPSSFHLGITFQTLGVLKKKKKKNSLSSPCCQQWWWVNYLGKLHDILNSKEHTVCILLLHITKISSQKQSVYSEGGLHKNNFQIEVWRHRMILCCVIRQPFTYLSIQCFIKELNKLKLAVIFVLENVLLKSTLNLLVPMIHYQTIS